tara:strand:- start:14135 stop:15670 length:1536 start_codon:yes stop_codon:yes gene_type:complete
MPNNYSITTFNFTEEILDAMYAGNMLEGGTMTITPDPGFVVSASDFSHGTPLPEAVATCVFTDTGIAGYPGNTVLVTFTFQNLFTITSSLPPIYIHIIGDATIFREDDRTISFHLDFIDNTVKNVNGSTVITAGAGVTETPPLEADALDSATGLQTTVLSGTVASGVQNVIATIDTVADSNYHFDNPPTIRTENIPDGVISFIFNSVVSRNANDEVTNWKHYLVLGANSNLSTLFGGKVFIEYTGVADRAATKEILKVVYGEPIVAAEGATRTIKVVGEVGAEFDLTVTKNSDNTSIMDVAITNADIIHNPGGLIRGINKTLVGSESGDLIAEHEFIQVYPASGSDEIYHINVTPKSGTILNSNLPQSPPQGIIYQYTNPTITLEARFGGASGNPANITYTGRPNSTPSRLRHIKSVPSMFQISYQLSHGSAISKGDNVTWSSTGTSSWSNSAYDSSDTTPANHGNHIEIVNIVQTATGANTASLTADVIIKKFGTKDVTMLITLDTFFTT